MTFANSTLVFAERHVELPVATVFYAPMIAHCTGEHLARKHFTDDVVSHTDLVTLSALCIVNRHADRYKILPPRTIGKIIWNLALVVAGGQTGTPKVNQVGFGESFIGLSSCGGEPKWARRRLGVPVLTLLF